MKRKSFFQYSLTAMIVFSMVMPAFDAHAQVEERIDTRSKRDVILYRGDIVSLKVYSLTRIAISTPGVVDIVNADINEILLVGKALGQTQIFLWDEFGKRSVLARVMEEDLDMVQERIELLLAAAELTGVKMQHSAYEGKLIATGKVNKVQKEKFDKVVEDFGGYLINMVETQGDLIQIDAQITELSTTLTKELGVKWVNEIGISEDSAPGAGSGLGDVFRIGSLSRTDTITATIRALLQTSKARDLARPSVVVSDGEEASIIVGGEVPITTSVSSDGAVSENVTYKSYGVQLSVTPEIMDDDKINVTLNVSISNQDTVFTGANSAFTTTTAQTKVLLDDGQTIIIAGLIQQGEDESEVKVPFLHRIPIIGKFLFTHKLYTKTPDKEIVISLTPRLRRQKNKLKTNQEIKEEEDLRKKAEDQWVETETQSGDSWKKKLENEMKKIEETAAEKMTEPEIETVPVSEDQEIDDMLKDIESMIQQTSALDVEEGVSALVTDYARQVQQKIAQKISFPYEAKEKGWEGVTVLSLTIFSDGTLGDATIETTSGHNVFDSDAINTAEIIAPFEPFPIELEMDELTISIPVAYNQDILKIN